MTFSAWNQESHLMNFAYQIDIPEIVEETVEEVAEEIVQETEENSVDKNTKRSMLRRVYHCVFLLACYSFIFHILKLI